MCATCGEETSIEERDLVDLSCGSLRLGIKTYNSLQWNLDVCSFLRMFVSLLLLPPLPSQPGCGQRAILVSEN